MTIRRLTDKVTDLQGDFEVFRSEGAEAPTTIPAAQTINIPPSPPIVNPGLLIEEGECPSGLVFASKCENPEFPSLTASASIDADGKTVTCSWSNTAGTARVGLFFVKLICRDL